MAIVKWDPFGEMLRMQRDMDRIFSRMGLSEEHLPVIGDQPWMPKIDIKRSGKDLLVHAELPGIKPEDVEVEVTGDLLTIKGERRLEEEKEDEDWVIRESSYGSFLRSIVIPEGVEPDAIKAEFHDGVLDVTVPGALEELQPSTTKVPIAEHASH